MGQGDSSFSQKQYQAAWYQENIEAQREKRRAYYLANREAIREKSRARYECNKEPTKARAAAWYRANKQRVRERDDAWKAKNPARARWISRRARWRVLGIEITPEQYADMLRRQRGKCAICGRVLNDQGGRVKRDTACVDHCHREKKVRGILCNGCNRALGVLEGMFERSSKRKVLAYLGIAA